MDIQKTSETFFTESFQELPPPGTRQDRPALPVAKTEKASTVDGRAVRQQSEGKIEIPSHSHKKPKTDKPLDARHTKKEDKTKHKTSHTKDKKYSHGKDASKTGFFSDSHFGIRENLTKGFHQIFQTLGLEAPSDPANEAEVIQHTIQNSDHHSALLVVNNALFHLVNTIDNRFFGDKIPDKAVNVMRDAVGKIVEHINLNTLPGILKNTQKPSSAGANSAQAAPSLQDVINATKQDSTIAESLPKALEALTGVTGLKPKSLGLGGNMQFAFNHAKLNLAKGIELIKEILKSDFHLGTLLMDLIPHFAQPILGEHKSEKAERIAWN